MSYNINYSTLPAFNNNSIGDLQQTVGSNSKNPIWFAPGPITLTPGVYYITSSICYLNSPNSYAYIILDNSTNNSIFFDGYYNYLNLNSFETYQGTNPNSSQTQGNIWNTYSSWYPVAGQQMRNGAPGASNCLSLSTIVSISTNTNVNTLAYTQSSGEATIQLYCVRLS
jgi:hypothetical protein